MFMFCKDRGLDFSVWLCREYARHYEDSHFTAVGWKKFAFQRFNRHQKINFQCRIDKKVITYLFENLVKKLE